jgi:hypothetical protein
VQDKELQGKAQYYAGEGNQLADWAWKLAEKKKASYSVGFRPIKSDRIEKDPENKEPQPSRIFKKQELIEISHVIIPANKNSLQKGMLSENMIIKNIAESIWGMILEDDVPSSYRFTEDFEEVKKCIDKGCTSCDGSCVDPDKTMLMSFNGKNFSLADLNFLHALKESQAIDQNIVISELIEAIKTGTNEEIKNMIKNVTTELDTQIRDMLKGILNNNTELKKAKDEGYIKQILQKIEEIK